jgi:hypothetical protein
MKLSKLVIVTDYGEIVIPDKVDKWINDAPPKKYKVGGTVHRRQIKAREKAVTDSVKTLIQMAWQHGNCGSTVEEALQLLVKNPRDRWAFRAS